MKKDDKIHELQNEIFKLKSELFKMQSKLDKAIKALEKYANTDNWMGFENDGDSELWCNEFFVQYDSDYEKLSGTTIYCAGRAARQTLKEIRGENDTITDKR